MKKTIDRFRLSSHRTIGDNSNSSDNGEKMGHYKLSLGLLIAIICFAGYVANGQAPVITSFSPASGAIGTLVTITGTNLSSPTALSIGGSAAIEISNTGTSLVALVMPGATTAGLSITTAGGIANSGSNFTVTPTPYPATQQGTKLVGTGNVGNARQGYSVAISADGNTAIVGGYGDNSYLGAAWVYTRSGSTWAQQGAKLVGTGAVGGAYQGNSVALSADGNTAIVGGSFDNGDQGAVWVFTRSGSTWTQQGTKLVSTGAIGAAEQGTSIALSADGNTAIVGGESDNFAEGAAWVYTRSGSIWTQQGAKLVGTGNIGAAYQGVSVALSADGNTAMAGGYYDNSTQGAAWVYTRSGSTWTQQGTKLVGSGNAGNARQGTSVSLSADGNTAIVGGYFDNLALGASWVYARSGSTWTQQGAKLVGAGAIGQSQQGISIAVSADGNTAIVGGYQDNSGQGAVWMFVSPPPPPPPPSISSFSPASGAIGTLVTIIGTNLSNPTALSIGGSTAIVISNTGSSLVALMMPGATTGGLSITTAGGSASSGSNFTVTPTQYPGAQQGTKLVGTGNTGAAWQGISIALSADGNTAIVGGLLDNTGQGAAWVYTRSGSTWTQQGTKLVGTGNTGAANQGFSVALSADGNTAIVGGYQDNSGQGAAWVYTRSGSTWTQQGAKLVGTGNIGSSYQGVSVALSADGNTAVIGGYNDNSGQGAAWVYTRSGSTWTQQGAKLVGTGNAGAANQGYSVALSADGNTAIIGGNSDNANEGAAWVYTRSGSTWTQQGAKLVGTGSIGAAQQGFSVGLNADGNTAIVGGLNDNSGEGAAWVYTRSGSTWTQQGAKLVGTGNTGAANQGISVSLSADGNTAIVSGFGDNNNEGAAWVYTRNGSTWAQQGAKLVGTGNIGAAYQGRSVALSANGNTAVLGGFYDNSNQGAAWVFVPPPPSITSFSPASGAIGTLVTITGTNLSNPTALSIGGSAAIVVSNTGTSLVVLVMPGAATGGLSITTASGSASSGSNFTVTPTPYPATQQGAKLVGTGNTGAAWQGISIALSADGNTAIVGGLLDNTGQGAAWVYTRSGSTWTQQGTKLLGTGNAGAANQGFSVALSADGNTAIVGGYQDNSGQGAAWVFTRSGSTWTQQGTKLVGTGNIGSSYQGVSVALSADGNTAVIGGYNDNSGQGAAWVYTRSGNIWTQQGAKLEGTGNVGAANQGYSVALSADGNTAIIGGNADNSNQGAAWVYTRSGSTWTQQGAKLVGTGSIGAAQQGFSVALSADGNTAIVGGLNDNSGEGAAWVYTRSGSSWTQQGAKLVGTGATGVANQGISVSLSADGNTAIVSGFGDNNNEGAAWVYTRSGSTWTQQGAKLVGTGNTGAAYQGRSAALSADGNTAVLGGFYDNSNQGAAWVFVPPPPPPAVTSFSPASGAIGTLVTITGTNLSNPTALSIGGSAAIVISNTGTSLVVLVMPGATTGGLSITTASGSASSGSNFTVTPTPYPGAQQGAKLVGTGNIGAAYQGRSIALSADGNTAIVGGYQDNSNRGAAWVYTRSGSSWAQQGAKLVGTGAVGAAYQGWSVALSADGNTAIVGGSSDNFAEGAAWVYTRSGSIWTQQGAKLVGTGNTGSAQQGSSVALSADGNTAIVGGVSDNSSQGAVWVYTRSGSTWTQQGAKLVGTGNVGAAGQGYSVALSADGNTAIVGGFQDNSGLGAAWVYTRSGSTWTQQGAKLVGAGAIGQSQQGYSVALSADGNTAMVGGFFDNSNQGAAWVYTRSGSTWTQQGAKLVGTGNTGAAALGRSVALTADGNTAIIGGSNDNTALGAAWVFTRSGSTWTQQGAKLVGTGNAGPSLQGWSAALSADGNTAMVGGYNDNSGQGAAWVFVGGGTPLAIMFTHITATKKDHHCAINWQVANEVDIITYEVEKSTDGVRFSKIADTRANGSNSYHTTDATPAAGNNYYRIRAINVSGTVIYSNVVSVNIGDEHQSFNMYPNPTASGTSPQLQISNLQKGVYSIRIYNTVGQLVVSKTLSSDGGSASVDLGMSEVSTGVYQLKVSDDSGQVWYQQKIVKQ